MHVLPLATRERRLGLVGYFAQNKTELRKNPPHGMFHHEPTHRGRRPVEHTCPMSSNGQRPGFLLLLPSVTYVRILQARLTHVTTHINTTYAQLGRAQAWLSRLLRISKLISHQFPTASAVLMGDRSGEPCAPTIFRSFVVGQHNLVCAPRGISLLTLNYQRATISSG